MLCVWKPRKRPRLFRHVLPDMEIGEFGVGRPDFGGRRPRGEALGQKKEGLRGQAHHSAGSQHPGQLLTALLTVYVRGPGAQRRFRRMRGGAPTARIVVDWEGY